MLIKLRLHCLDESTADLVARFDNTATDLRMTGLELKLFEVFLGSGHDSSISSFRANAK